ncbi:zinc ribbon domain-containing protein [Candidatus Woesearchaeota archaeon]|nr:zinc ribbon domain-containing protein [Candidatus Woesearchaeota archaeon]
MSYKEEKSINTNQVKHSIKEIIQRSMTPSNRKKKIVSLLFDYVSEKNFLDIIMESFKLNPEFFKGWLYEDLMRKVEKSYGNKKRKEFEIVIIEKYCLFNGEQILYVCKGNISQKRRRSYRFYVDQGRLFVTTDRIIALGRLRVFESKSSLFFSFREYEKDKDFMMGLSGQKELLFFGYQFPISNRYNLEKKSRSIKYEVNQSTYIEISFTKSMNSTYSIEERRDRLFEILDKEIITSKPITEISPLKTEEIQSVPSVLDEKDVKPITEGSYSKINEVQLQSTISEENERKGTYCGQCGVNIEEGKPYCHICGKLVLKIKPEEKQVTQPPIRGPIEEKVLIEKEVAEEQIEEVVLPEEEVVVKIITEICKFCGANVLAGKTYCSNCGKLLKIPIEEKVLVEKELMAEKPLQEEFLPGEEEVVEEPIEEEVLPEEEVVIEEQIVEEVSPEEEVVVKELVEEIFFFCKFCGIKLDKGASFCPQCGTIVKKK